MEKQLYNIDGYTITDDGHIYSLNYNHTGKKKELKGYIDKDGYNVILIKCKSYPNGIKIKRYRAVAEHFIDNPDNLPMVNHKDTIKTHDWVSNLEWCDNAYNQRYSVERGSHSKQEVSVICSNGNTYRSISEASRCTGVSRSSIKKVILGEYKQCKGYTFKY